MTFKVVVDAVLLNSFAEASRADAKEWVRGRHALLWDYADWSFKYGTDPVTVTANSATVGSLATDLHSVIALYNSDGQMLRGYRDHIEFYERYNANLGDTGKPEAYTVIGSAVIVGPVSSETASDYLMVYKKRKPTLTNDGDATGIPDGYDLALVHGGKAEGYKLSNIPLWEGFDANYGYYVGVMERVYVNALDGSQEAFAGSYRPDVWK